MRVVVDGHLSFPLTAGVAATALTTPTWVITLPTADANRRKALADSGVEILEVPPDSAGKPDLQEGMKLLGSMGLTRVLVEGGSRIAAALVRSALVDRVIWFRAPILLGGDGVPVLSGLGVGSLHEAPVLRRIRAVKIGEDMMESYVVEHSFKGGRSAGNSAGR